jgi:YD repeat-containing protein
VTYAYTLDCLLEPVGVKTDFSYDKAGNRTRTDFPKGVTTSTSFDNSNRTETVTIRRGTASSLVRRAYDYRRGTSDLNIYRAPRPAQCRCLHAASAAIPPTMTKDAGATKGSMTQW